MSERIAVLIAERSIVEHFDAHMIGVHGDQLADDAAAAGQNFGVSVAAQLDVALEHLVILIGRLHRVRPRVQDLEERMLAQNLFATAGQVAINEAGKHAEGAALGANRGNDGGEALDSLRRNAHSSDGRRAEGRIPIVIPGRGCATDAASIGAQALKATHHGADKTHKRLQAVRVALRPMSRPSAKSARPPMMNPRGRQASQNPKEKAIRPTITARSAKTLGRDRRLVGAG